MRDYRALRALIDDDPEMAELSDLQVAQALNAQTETRLVNRWITKRTILSEFGLADGTTMIETLRVAAESNPAMANVLDLLEEVAEGGGLNIGHPNTRVAMPLMVSAGIITQAQADQLLALGTETVSRAQVAGLGCVLEGHVMKARAL